MLSLTYVASRRLLTPFWRHCSCAIEFMLSIFALQQQRACLVFCAAGLISGSVFSQNVRAGAPGSNPLPTTDVYVSCQFGTLIIYTDCFVVSANSRSEATQLHSEASRPYGLYGDFFADRPRNRVFKCSDIVGANMTRGWWALVRINIDEYESGGANAAFTCGYRSFNDALAAAYIRAVNSAKRNIKTIIFQAGIAAPPRIERDSGYGAVSPFSFSCSLAENAKPDPAWNTMPLPRVPIDPNATDVGINIVKACGPRPVFKNIPVGYSASDPPLF